MRAVCIDGQLVTNGTYTCNSNEVCDKRNDLQKCYTQANDCLDIYNAGFIKSGVYTIKPVNWFGIPFKVFCNMTDGGGWTVSKGCSILTQQLALNNAITVMDSLILKLALYVTISKAYSFKVVHKNFTEEILLKKREEHLDCSE